MPLVEASPAPSGEQLHILDATATRLSDQTRDDLTADPEASGILCDDHFGDECVKRAVADESPETGKASRVIAH
ncbi:MAG: hypothetical protein PGN24_00760 [Microbacterium arborescens]